MAVLRSPPSAVEELRALSKQPDPTAALTAWKMLPPQLHSAAVHGAALQAVARSARLSSGHAPQPMHAMRQTVVRLDGFMHLSRACTAAAAAAVEGAYTDDRIGTEHIDVADTTALLVRLCTGTEANDVALHACDIMAQWAHRRAAVGKSIHPTKLCTLLDAFSSGLCADWRRGREDTLAGFGPLALGRAAAVAAHPLLAALAEEVKALDWGRFWEEGSDRRGRLALRNGSVVQAAHALHKLLACGFIDLRPEELLRFRQGVRQRLKLAMAVTSARVLELQAEGLLSEASSGGGRVASLLPRHMARENEQIASALLALADLDQQHVRDVHPLCTFWQNVGELLADPVSPVVLSDAVRQPGQVVQLCRVFSRLEESRPMRTVAALAMQVQEGEWGDDARVLAKMGAAVGPGAPAAIFHLASEAMLREVGRWKAGGWVAPPPPQRRETGSHARPFRLSARGVFDVEQAFRKARVHAPTLVLRLTDYIIGAHEEAAVGRGAPGRVPLAPRTGHAHHSSDVLPGWSEEEPPIPWRATQLVHFASWLARTEAGHVPVGADVKQRTPMKHDRFFAWLAKRLEPAHLLSPDILDVSRRGEAEERVDEGGAGERIDPDKGLFPLSSLLFALAISGRVAYYVPMLTGMIEALHALPEAQLHALASGESPAALRNLHTFDAVVTALRTQKKRMDERGPKRPRNRSSSVALGTKVASSGPSNVRDDVRQQRLGEVLTLPRLPRPLLQAGHTAVRGHETLRKYPVPPAWFDSVARALEVSGPTEPSSSDVEHALVSTLDDAHRRVFDTYVAVRGVARRLGLPQPEPDYMTEQGYLVDVAVDWGVAGGHRPQERGAPSSPPPARQRVMMPYGMRGIAILLREKQGVVGQPVETFEEVAAAKRGVKRGGGSEARPPPSEGAGVPRLEWSDLPGGPAASINSMEMLDAEMSSPERNARIFVLQQAGWMVIELRRHLWKEQQLGVYVPPRAHSGGGEEGGDDEGGGTQERAVPARHHVLFRGHRTGEKLQHFIMDRLKAAGLRVEDA